MNSRHVHDFMRKQFPDFEEARLDWKIVADELGPRLAELKSLLMRYLGEGEIIVEVHRKLGAALVLEEAITFIGSHIGEGQVRATNRGASGFVVIARNGVAAGWHKPENTL